MEILNSAGLPGNVNKSIISAVIYSSSKHNGLIRSVGQKKQDKNAHTTFVTLQNIESSIPPVAEWTSFILRTAEQKKETGSVVHVKHKALTL